MEATINNARRIEDSISQCLSQSKRPLGLLLGAGCPASIKVADAAGGNKPLIPDIAGLTESVNHALSASHPDYQDLVSGLAGDLDRTPNIEDILSYIRDLALIVGQRQVHGLGKAQINDLETVVTAQITEMMTVELPAERTPYDDVAIWVQAVTLNIPIRIFTTNYDLLLEDAFERCGVPFFDGFTGARKPFLDAASIEYDDLPPRWTRIIKLHGSASWSVQEDDSIIRSFLGSSDDRRLIHPSHLKYAESRRMPYLIMFDQLRDFFKHKSATLIALGYSFRDDHINDLIVQGLRGNASAKVFALQYDVLDAYGSATELARLYPGLTVVANDGAIDAGIDFDSVLEGNGEALFRLGDFERFGRHLRQSVGRSSAPPMLPTPAMAESDDT